MPIYEYLCQSCGFGKDVLQKLSDAPLTECPKCGTDQYRKQISAAGFRLKGQGWYETDFKTGAKKNLAGDAAKPSSAAATTK
ncbi:MAG TPA: transcriptional regulator [Oceanospirillaceae bacterium]|nr:transcriptional regulator [Oceanospirillaceae bacterium]